MKYLIFITVLSSSYAITIFPIPENLTPPSSRRSISVAYDQNSSTVYVFGGGRQSGETFTNILWKYNTDTNKWNQMPLNSPNIPEPRAGCSMAIFNNSIYVYGGATNYGPSSDFWKYDLERYIWTEIDVEGDFPSEKAFAAYYTFEWNNTTFMAMFGGYNQISSSNSLYL